MVLTRTTEVSNESGEQNSTIDLRLSNIPVNGRQAFTCYFIEGDSWGEKSLTKAENVPFSKFYEELYFDEDNLTQDPTKVGNLKYIVALSENLNQALKGEGFELAQLVNVYRRNLIGERKSWDTFLPDGTKDKIITQVSRVQEEELEPYLALIRTEPTETARKRAVKSDGIWGIEPYLSGELVHSLDGIQTSLCPSWDNNPYSNPTLEDLALQIGKGYEDFNAILTQKKSDEVVQYIQEKTNWLIELIRGILIPDTKPEHAHAAERVPVYGRL